MRTKNSTVFMSTSQMDHDVIVLVETWLNADFNDGEFFDTNMYRVFRKDRDFASIGCTLGGGVLIATKKHLTAMLVDMPNCESTLDQLCIRLAGDNVSLYIIVSYIPPNSNYELYNAHVQNIFKLAPSNDCDGCLVFGDFNLSKIVWSYAPNYHSMFPSNVNSPLEINFIDTVCSVPLRQINSFKNGLGRILDLVFISDNVKFSIDECPNPITAPDIHHVPLVVNIEFYKFNCLEYASTYDFDFNACNFELIDQIIFSVDWIDAFKAKSVDECYSVFISIIMEIFKQNIPRRKPKNHKIPWYTKGLKKLKNLRNKFYKVYESTKSIESKLQYEHYSREFNFLNKFLYNQYIISFEHRINDNPKLFFNFIRSKLQRSDYPTQIRLGNEHANSAIEKANLFADFFKSNFQSANFPVNASVVHNVSPITDLGIIQFLECDVLAALSVMDNSFKPDVDGIPSVLLRKCCASLALPLKLMFNNSLMFGTFPNQWKISSITPIFKKGDKSDVCNYRPISKLSNISKIFEHLVYDTIYHSTFNFLSPCQHGFMKKRSTVSNLLTFTNYCFNIFKSGLQVDSIYFDFCKAFDTISHSVLFIKLASMGFHSSLLNWFESYLSNRLCFVSIDNASSYTYVAKSGVPQGSILGPFLFILFINDIGSCFKYANFLLYADDLKVFFKVASMNDALCLQDDINRLISWCSMNHLTINISKCFHLPLGRRTYPLNTSYVLGSQHVKKVCHILDLGIMFDAKLDFRAHIDYLMPRAYKVLAFIKRNSKDFTNPYTRKLLYSSFVRSKLDYGSIIYNPYYDVHANRIERLQKKILKFALNDIAFSDPIPSYQARCRLIHLDILSNRRSKFSILFLYKIICGLIDSSVLLGCINFNTPVRCLRHHEYFNIPTTRSKYAANEPILRAMREYNSITCDIDFSYSLSKFNEILNLYYF